MVRVAQPNDLPGWRTAPALVRSQARAQGLRREAARARAGQALGWVGLAETARRPLCTLPPEQRARVAMAVALVRVPGLLLWQPPVNLDAGTRAALCATLCALSLRWGSVALIAGDERLPDTQSLQPERLLD